MPTLQFTGRIHPDVGQISVTNVPTVNWTDEEIGLEMAFSFQIEKSAVRVECRVNRFTPDDIVPIWMRAFDLVRAAVDLTCFSTGIGATVILDILIDPSGARSTLLADSRKLLSGICTAFSLGGAPGGDFSTVLNIVLKEPALFMAMNDLVTAITLPHHSPVTCARAVERLRNIITLGVSGKGKGWESLRHNLQIDKEYLEFITGKSTGPRHGDPARVSGNITTEMVRRAWIIMNRFLEFRKRGNKPLASTEFPMLTS